MWASALIISGCGIALAVAMFFFFRRSKTDVPNDAFTTQCKRRISIEPHDNPGLLLAAMQAFEGSGQISFEAYDDDLRFRELPGATDTQIGDLRRTVLFPFVNFIVIPLTRENIEIISSRLAWEPDSDWDCELEQDVPNGRMVSTSFIHVHIAGPNGLAFAAYDKFRSDCIVVTDRFPLENLDRLVADGVIRSYEAPKH